MRKTRKKHAPKKLTSCCKFHFDQNWKYFCFPGRELARFATPLSCWQISDYNLNRYHQWELRPDLNPQIRSWVWSSMACEEIWNQFNVQFSIQSLTLPQCRRFCHFQFECCKFTSGEKTLLKCAGTWNCRILYHMITTLGHGSTTETCDNIRWILPIAR